MKREDVTLAAVAERVLRGRRSVEPVARRQQQHLVARVGDRVDRLGQHRGRAGQRPGGELRHGDEQVGGQGGDDRPGASFGTHR